MPQRGDGSSGTADQQIEDCARTREIEEHRALEA